MWVVGFWSCSFRVMLLQGDAPWWRCRFSVMRVLETRQKARFPASLFNLSFIWIIDPSIHFIISGQIGTGRRTVTSDIRYSFLKIDSTYRTFYLFFNCRRWAIMSKLSAHKIPVNNDNFVNLIHGSIWFYFLSWWGRIFIRYCAQQTALACSLGRPTSP